MARSGLSGRLGRIREGQKSLSTGDRETAAPDRRGPSRDSISAALERRAAGKKSEPAEETAAQPPIEGWTQSAPLLLERETVMPIPEYRKGFSVWFPLLFPRIRSSLSESIDADGFDERLTFFDLETTGLSHGAGTVAFMAGVGRLIPGPRGKGRSLRLTQLLLQDYPGEAAFLSRFVELVGNSPVLVSFNGKCFDSQILANRFLMNAMRPRFMAEPTMHLDLLFPSRRLWKNELGSCRLSAVEEGILGILRDDDLPGSEAPDAWFEYVREGERGRLSRIGDHNRDDCVSLARLLYSLDAAIEDAEGRAALVRAMELRAGRDYAAATEFLRPLADSGDETALRMLAIDCEHRLGDYETALGCAERLGDEKRAERIRAKAERNGPR
ncbi:MAG TPA: ribonuclease H-like domain-containing protein [Treponemataceae bacterium]|nr:ribonuclease H-like domain-containing protein [Treponemataceae bacterium]